MRSMFRWRPLPSLAGGILLFWTALAQADLIDFESLADGNSVGLSYPGVSFSNATVIRAGLSLNEFEFPPRSGEAVAFDDGGVMQLSFGAAIDFFEGYFIYSVPVVITAYDASNAVVASATTLFGNNLALSGEPGSQVDELLQVSGSSIRRIEIAGNPGGTSFALDDATYRLQQTPIPEPSSLALFGVGVATVMLARRRRKTFAEGRTGTRAAQSR